jgi:geranylgeranyl reductase family protein
VTPVQDADVVVVGAGPAGSTAAYHLAQAGLDVLLLEKSSFPRDKVCGDGLTPRAVRSLVRMGIDTSERSGWARNRGLRILGGGVRLELAWPELAAFPAYGLIRPRVDFDEVLARQAQKAGARLHEQTIVTEPVVDARTGRVAGVAARSGRGAVTTTYRAPVVLAADGVSARLALALGIRRREDRPMGVAVRRYYTSPRTGDDFMESHLELWDGPPGKSRLLPGYGWIFGVGDGTVNVGLGILNTSAAFQHTDYRDLLGRWLAAQPAEWGLAEEAATGPVRGGALPMGFSRKPHYARGLLLLGDAGGMVNPFNGEGIAYAMESAETAADVVQQALARPRARDRERVLDSYPGRLRQQYGGYFTSGRLFVGLMGSPTVMRLATRYGLPRPALMRVLLKLMANLTDPRGGDASDRVVNALSRLMPGA